MKPRLTNYLALLFVLFVQVIFAQEGTVSGTVSDVNGLPLPGVSILVKGTNTGTQTDFDGSFKIKAGPQQILVFSYIGLKNREVVASAASKVVMQDNATELEGVVVTAFGIKRKDKAIGYAAQSVKGSTLTEARESNVVNSLSGRIAGVQVTGSSGAVGASSRIVLRGNSSITGNNQALFVVDGVPFDNSSSGDGGGAGGQDLPNGVASINPDDIESVTVLKGPNAAALYGLRASNGVILITTKTGKSSKGLGISFNTNVTYSDPLVLPSYQNSYGQGATSDYFEYVDGAGGGVNDGVDESWGAPLDVGLSFVQWDSFKVGGAPKPWISHPDNVKDFYETGIQVSNNLSLSGGNDKSNFRMSIGNTDEKGMIPSTDFRKFNLSANGNLILSDKISSGVNFLYSNDKSNNIPTVGYDGNNAAQQITLFSARNINFSDLRDWRNLPVNGPEQSSAGTPINWNNNFQNNPYWVLETNRNTYDRDRFTGSAFLSIALTKNLTATGKSSLDQYSQLITNREAIGSNTNLDGIYAERSLRYAEINAEFFLNYKNKITNDIDLSLNIGANQLKRTITEISGSLPALELPNLYNLSNIKTGSIKQTSNDYNEQRIGSIIGFGQVAFKNYFFIDFSGRNDWSSVLPVKNNSFFYPSVNGSFVISDAFDLKSPNLNLLKVRGGWSKVGGTGALSAYRINPIFTLADDNSGYGGGYGSQAQFPNVLYNPDLKPESVVGTEIGLDLNAFNNRLRFSGTYYTKISSDLLVPLQVSASTGFTNIWNNVADMENKGIELQLGVTAVKTNDFSFDIDLNFAQNKNTVTSLNGFGSYIIGAQWGVTVEAREGEAYGALVGRGFERDENGSVIYENGLPKVETTRKILGNITPDWTGGANFTFGYKNFDLSTLIDAKIGGDIHSMTTSWGRYSGVLEETLVGRESGVVGNGVMSDGAGGFVQNNVVVSAKSFNQAAFSNSVEESAIFDASYVKLRQITLGYSLPKKWLQGTAITDFKFSVVGRNLAILHKNVPHIDPETAFSSANGSQGQEAGQLPSARSYGFNINIKF